MDDHYRSDEAKTSVHRDLTAVAADRLLCVIQARRTSSRLPDKIMKTLGGVEVLAHVIRRAKAIPSVTRVVVATVDAPESEAVRDIANREGADCYMGSEHDVLSRFYDASCGGNAQHIMRVTADCPLLDPAVCEELYQRVKTENADYIVTAGWPHGTDCEVFRGSALVDAHARAVDALDREHVTLFIKANTDLKRIYAQPATNVAASRGRWVLDYPEDLEFLEAVFRETSHDTRGSWQSLQAFLLERPDIVSINRHCAEHWQIANESVRKMESNRDTSG